MLAVASLPPQRAAKPTYGSVIGAAVNRGGFGAVVALFAYGTVSGLDPVTGYTCHLEESDDGVTWSSLASCGPIGVTTVPGAIWLVGEPEAPRSSRGKFVRGRFALKATYMDISCVILLLNPAQTPVRQP
jgi:hypothetical protein